MLDKLKVHYKFKFLIKITNIKGKLEISKVGPVLTQLGLEDGSTIDDFIKEYYTVYCNSEIYKTLKSSEIYTIFELIIWRSSNVYNTIIIRPWTIDTLLKSYLDTTRSLSFRPFRVVNNRKHNWGLARRRRQKQSKLYNFSVYWGVHTCWSPEWGYRFKLDNLQAMLKTEKPTFLSYSKRFEMLGRKVNFRRKVLKKKFEDYT